MPSGSTMAKILKRGRLIVGVDQNTFLFGYRDPATGNIVGFDIDIAREVARAIFGDPDKVQLVAITAAQRIPDVQNGTVDMVADTMTVNCDRLKQVNFSSIYYDAGQRVLVPVDIDGHRHRRPRRQEGLRGGRQHVDREHRRRRRPSRFRSRSPTGPTAWCCCSRTRSTRSPPTTPSSTACRPRTRRPSWSAPAFTDEPYGMAIAKRNPDLVRFVNAVLAKIHSNGRWAEIYRKWLGPGGVPSPPRVTYEG